jgi:hypothetical protein
MPKKIAMEELFKVSMDKDCSVTNYTITADQEGTTVMKTLGTASIIENSILEIDQSSPATMTFFVFARTLGGKTAFKKVYINTGNMNLNFLNFTSVLSARVDPPKWSDELPS